MNQAFIISCAGKLHNVGEFSGNSTYLERMLYHCQLRVCMRACDEIYSPCEERFFKGHSYHRHLHPHLLCKYLRPFGPLYGCSKSRPTFSIGVQFGKFTECSSGRTCSYRYYVAQPSHMASDDGRRARRVHKHSNDGLSRVTL